MLGEPNHKRIFPLVLCAGTLFVGAVFLFFILRSPSSVSAMQPFEISPGEGFQAIVDRLSHDGLIRSGLGVKLYLILGGKAHTLKPGVYLLNPAMSAPKIISILVDGLHNNVTVTIREGASRFDIDAALAKNGVLRKGEFLRVTSSSLEGMFFPDTYQFFTGSRPEDVARIMLDNFTAKTATLFSGHERDMSHALRIASLLENEVPEYEDRRIVAGIIEKRLKINMPLQIDATICFIKKSMDIESKSCYPLTPLDFKIDSPYNTYLYRGLPPTPIGNPGLDAIRAALSPKASPYLFYLSDPVSKKTIFSQTLDIHIKNEVKYLKR